jgi:LmbE family N-acetylglucosaminyl deacetylase
VLKRDGPVEVVNVCTGIPDRGFVTRYDRLIRATESAALFEARIEEDRAALALAGRAPRGLGFLEAQYRDEPLDRRGVAAALESEIPACSGIVLPAGIGGHEDHVAVRDAGFELADGAVPITLYAELPYAIHKGWPHWVTGADPDPHLDPESDWDFYLETVPCPGDALRPAPRTLSEAEADEKLAALRTYRTQFSSLNSGAIDRFGNPGVRSHEMFWSVDLSRA